MTTREVKRRVNAAKEEGSLWERFDPSDYTEDQVRVFVQESLDIANRAREALRSKQCRRLATPEQIAKGEAELDSVVSASNQTLAEL
jgi:hypothetical protein